MHFIVVVLRCWILIVLFAFRSYRRSLRVVLMRKNATHEVTNEIQNTQIGDRRIKKGWEKKTVCLLVAFVWFFSLSFLIQLATWAETRIAIQQTEWNWHLFRRRFSRSFCPFCWFHSKRTESNRINSLFLFFLFVIIVSHFMSGEIFLTPTERWISSKNTEFCEKNEWKKKLTENSAAQVKDQQRNNRRWTSSDHRRLSFFLCPKHVSLLFEYTTEHQQQKKEMKKSFDFTFVPIQFVAFLFAFTFRSFLFLFSSIFFLSVACWIVRFRLCPASKQKFLFIRLTRLQTNST